MKKKSASKKGFFSNISMKFGEMARRLGLISNSDIKDALVEQESGQDDRRIGKVLVDNNKMTTKDVNEVLNTLVEFETFMTVKEEEKSTKTTTKKSARKKPAKAVTKTLVKKKPAKAATKTSVKKKSAKATTKKSVKKKPARAVTKKSIKKKAAKRKPSK